MTNLPSQFRRTHELPWYTVLQSYIFLFASVPHKANYNLMLNSSTVCKRRKEFNNLEKCFIKTNLVYLLPDNDSSRDRNMRNSSLF